MKKTLKDTYVYKVLGLDGTIAKCAKINSNLSEYAVKPEVLDNILNEIKYKINFPSKIKLIDELKKGGITLVDTAEATAIPAWLSGDGNGGVKTSVVNVFGKMRTNSSGQVQFNVREIFALSQVGLVVKEFYLKEQKITYNLQMSKLAVTIYERMVYRVLDILYSLDVGPFWLRTQVKVELRLFCATYLLEREKDDAICKYVLQDVLKGSGTTIENLASQATSPGANTDRYDSLPMLIEFLSKLNPILKDLDITSFLRKFIMMYGEKALLMLESYSYFLAMCMSVTVSGNVVKDFGLEPVVGKEGIQMYNNFFDLTR